MSVVQPNIPVLLITGPVGVGKTTVASELSELLSKAGVPHGLIDMDWLRECHPSRVGDPFHTALGMKNLAAVSANFRVEGAKRLIVVDILEARDDLKHYLAAIPGAAIVVVRLQASVPTLISRVERRQVWSGLEWHRHRAAELAAQMERDRVEDILVDTEGKSPITVAQEILTQSRWVTTQEQ